MLWDIDKDVRELKPVGLNFRPVRSGSNFGMRRLITDNELLCALECTDIDMFDVSVKVSIPVEPVGFKICGPRIVFFFNIF
jgi:hypothetical protein